jgi:hypothetical protein
MKLKNYDSSIFTTTGERRGIKAMKMQAKLSREIHKHGVNPQEGFNAIRGLAFCGFVIACIAGLIWLVVI